MSDSQFILDMLFVSVFADDHEDAMLDILDCICDPDEEPDLNDLALASDFAGAYHVPTSLEQEMLNMVHKALTMEYLNG